MERVLQPLTECQTVRILIHVEEVGPQPRRQQALTVECEERVVHREVVLVRDTTARRVRLERTLVKMGRQTERRIVLERSERRAHPGLVGQLLVTKRQQRARRARGATANRAVGSDVGNAPGAQPCFAEAVRPRAPLSRLNVDRAVDSVELGQVWQPLLRELHCGHRPDRRDEFARRHVTTHLLIARDHVRDREQILKQHVIPWPVANKNDVRM